MFPFLYLCVHVGCKVNGIYLIVMTFCVCELMTKSLEGVYFPLSLSHPGGKINVTCRFTSTLIVLLFTHTQTNNRTFISHFRRTCI